MKKILASIIPFVGIFLTSLLAFNTAFSQHANSISYYEPPTDKVIYMDVLRNDTVFELIFNKADSTIEVRDTNVNIGNGWWLMLSQSNGFIVVQCFRKIRPSLDFKKVNIKFAAQSEMQMTRCLAYKDLKLCQYSWRIGPLAYRSPEIEQPKRKIRKRFLNAYMQIHTDTGLQIQEGRTK